MTVLSGRTLNRTLLSRQFLLDRGTWSAAAMIAYLAGMQAQVPNAPYVGLWQRIADFEFDELAQLMLSRAVVRIPMMRSTIHLLTADDALSWYTIIAPRIANTFRHGQFGRDCEGIDLDELVAYSRQLFEESPKSRAELMKPLAQRWPGHNPGSTSYAATLLSPVVQPTPRGVWGQRGRSSWTTLQHYLGRELLPGDVHAMIRRYLASCGPSSVADVQAWCGLTRLREVVEPMRNELRTYRDAAGVELFDLPDSSIADADLPARPIFLPEYDNVLLSHADRTRIMPGTYPLGLFGGTGVTQGTLLVDGFYVGIWHLIQSESTATIQVDPDPVAQLRATTELDAAAAELLSVIAPSATQQQLELVSG